MEALFCFNLNKTVAMHFKAADMMMVLTFHSLLDAHNSIVLL